MGPEFSDRSPFGARKGIERRTKAKNSQHCRNSDSPRGSPLFPATENDRDSGRDQEHDAGQYDRAHKPDRPNWRRLKNGTDRAIIDDIVLGRHGIGQHRCDDDQQDSQTELDFHPRLGSVRRLRLYQDSGSMPAPTLTLRVRRSKE